jgi:alpha-glucosidase (family GH31 glycosyl hydrolase)
MDFERKHLSFVDSVDIIDYVKKSVEILMSMREDEFENYNKNWRLQEQIRTNKEKQASPAE